MGGKKVNKVVALDDDEVVIKKNELESYQFANALLSKILRFRSCLDCYNNECTYRVKEDERSGYPRVNCINWWSEKDAQFVKELERENETN